MHATHLQLVTKCFNNGTGRPIAKKSSIDLSMLDLVGSVLVGFDTIAKGLATRERVAKKYVR